MNVETDLHYLDADSLIVWKKTLAVSLELNDPIPGEAVDLLRIFFTARSCGRRVERADILEELAAARAAMIRHNETVNRTLFGACTRETNMNRHVTFSLKTLLG